MSTITVSNNKRKSSTPIRFNSRKVARRTVVPRSITSAPFPAKQTKMVTYCDSAFLSTAASQPVGNYELRANSIFDPDASGTGHKPYGYSTFASLYSYYSVKSATVDVTFAELNNESAMSFSPKMCGVWTNEDGDEVVDQNLVREQPGSNSKLLINDSTVTVRTKYIRDRKYPGYAQNDVGAAFGANPTDLVVFNLFTTKNTAFSGADNTVAYFKITYEVEMWEPKKLASS